MKLSNAGHRAGCTAIALATGALLACAGAAGAATYNPPDTPALQAAVASANASVGVPDVIQLTPGVVYAPDATLQIDDDLLIRGTPTLQQPAQAPTILQGTAIPSGFPFIKIAEGVNLTFNAIQEQTGGTIADPAIVVGGNFRLENSSISGNPGDAVVTDPNVSTSVPSITVVNSIVHANQKAGIIVGSNSTLSMNYATVTQNSGTGLVLDGSADIRNSIVVLNPNGNCIGSAFSFPGQVHVNYVTDTDVDQNTSPGVGDCSFYDPTGVGNLTVANTTSGVGIGTFLQNGGPTRTRALTAASSSRNSADPAGCPTVDQRYFVRTDGLCDRGSFELNAVRDTVGPTCVVTGLRTGPPKQQDVTARDTASGLASIGSIQITNGTVATPPFTAGTVSGVVVTATKTDQLLSTRWSFDAADVAGNTTHCQ
jgi:hypothetical protein